MSFCRSLQSELQEAEKDELDSSSGCDMSFELSSENLNSPPRHSGPRKLDFTEGQTPVPSKLTFSPPYKRVCNQFSSSMCVKTSEEKQPSAESQKNEINLFCSSLDVCFCNTRKNIQKTDQIPLKSVCKMVNLCKSATYKLVCIKLILFH